jgi:hypothetical protein
MNVMTKACNKSIVILQNNFEFHKLFQITQSRLVFFTDYVAKRCKYVWLNTYLHLKLIQHSPRNLQNYISLW